MFGDGEQERDCLYVDDVVECLLARGALVRTPPGEVFNVGNDEHLSLRAIAEAVVAAAGSGSVELVPWPPDRDAIDIGSYFGDSSKAKRVLGLGAARSRFADGIGAHGRVLPRARARGTCERRPTVGRRAPGRRPRPARRRASSPSCRARDRARGARRAAYLLGPETEAFEAEFAEFCGRRTRSRWRRAPTRCGSRCVALGVGAGDEVIVPAFTAVPTAAAVCAAGATPVPVDVDAETAALDAAAAAAAVTDRTTAGDPGPPLRPARADSRPRRAGGRRRARRPTVRSTRGSGSAAACLQLLPDQEPRRHRRRRRGRHRRRRARGAGPAPAPPRRRAATTRTSPWPGNSRLSEVEAAALRVGLAPSAGAERAPAGDRGARTGRRPRAAAGRLPHERHVYHLCVVRVADRAGSAPGCRSRPRSTTRAR